MPEGENHRLLADEIAARFLSEFRAGLDPQIRTFCDQHPEIPRLEAVLSMALMLENAKPDPSTECSNTSSRRFMELPRRLGDFRLIRVAGVGGMGVVYEAVQESLERRVAIKVLPSEVTGDERSLARFLREARAVALLHHTNIVPIFAVGEDQRIYYYVMPFIDGVGLNQVISELRRPSLQSPGSVANEVPVVKEWKSVHEADQRKANHSYWNRVASIGLQVADAIDYACSQGVLHRDIKPSNLMVDNDSAVWVTDFGLAKVNDNLELTEKGQVLGTLLYAAPERLQGIHDVRGDIYSLGMTLYELLTLRTPFDAVEKLQLVRQVTDSIPAIPRSVDHRIPIDLETIVLKAIAKDPRHRYQTAESMANDLRLFLDNRPIQSRRSGPMERSWRWCRRNPVVSSLMGCIALLMLASIVVLSIANARVVREMEATSDALREKEFAFRERASALDQSRQNATLAESRLYAAQVNLAGQAYQRGEITRAEDLLNSALPNDGQDFRGFEWNYLDRAVHHGLRKILNYPGSEIMSLSFSPTGKLLLIGGGNLESGFASIIDVESGKTVFDRTNLKTSVNGCDFSPDGSMFALACGNGNLSVLDSESFEELRFESTQIEIRSSAWSPKGNILVAGGERGELAVWRMADFKSIKIPNAHRGPILRIAFARNSEHFYTSSDWGSEGRISRRWDASSWPPTEFASYPDQSVTDESSDGQTLVGLNWGELRLSNTNDGQTIQTKIISTGPLVSAKYGDDGKTLFVASRTDRAIQKLNPSTLRVIQTGSQTNAVSAFAIGPVGRYWAAGDVKGSVRIWDLDIPQPQIELTDSGIRNAFALPGEDGILIGGNSSSQLWTFRDNTRSPYHRPTGLRAVSTDGKTLVCVSQADSPDASEAIPNDSIEVWREGNDTPFSIPLIDPIYENCIAVSATGRWLAVRSDGKPISLFDLTRQSTDPIRLIDAQCFQFAFSPDEKWLAGGQQFGSVSCFETETGNQLKNFAEFDSFWTWGMCVAFNSDGRYLASGNESGVVKVWETQSRELVSTLTGQPGEIRSIVFFPDDRRLAVGGTGDVHVWDFQSGQELLGLPIRSGMVESLALNRSADTLVAVTTEGHALAWTAAKPSAGKPSARK